MRGRAYREPQQGRWPLVVAPKNACCALDCRCCGFPGAAQFRVVTPMPAAVGLPRRAAGRGLCVGVDARRPEPAPPRSRRAPGLKRGEATVASAIQGLSKSTRAPRRPLWRSPVDRRRPKKASSPGCGGRVSSFDAAPTWPALHRASVTIRSGFIVGDRTAFFSRTLYIAHEFSTSSRSRRRAELVLSGACGESLSQLVFPSRTKRRSVEAPIAYGAGRCPRHRCSAPLAPPVRISSRRNSFFSRRAFGIGLEQIRDCV
jgi:hypothetical protein